MARAAANTNDELGEALESKSGSAVGSAELQEVFDRAKQRFEIAAHPQLEQRSLSLLARRFVNIPGAQWEGDFGAFFDNAVKLEINLTKDGLEKIKRDYNENRIVPDFRPAGGKGDEESAMTLDGLHRADAYCYKSQQGWDNAFSEAAEGGFGAWRLKTEWADPYDKESDAQRINPGVAITDADQRVFFDPDSTLYDKSDAKYAFLITAKQRQTFEDEHEGAIADWVVPQPDPPYDWFTPDTVKVAEYYEIEDATDKLLILTNPIAKAEERYWQSEIDPAELADLKHMGWRVKTRKLERKRVHKYLMSGEEVLEDQGYIAGDRIPIVPVYGKRSYVDGVERYEGFVQSRMDVQRLYNSVVSRLAETNAMSPRDIPIFLSSQVPPHIADLWSRQVVERHAYAVVDPVIDPVTGGIAAMGPIGKVEAPQVSGVEAALLQVARGDLVEGTQDGAEEVKANTSADALEVAAARVDAKSGIYLDNFRQSMECSGAIYLSMGADVYFEAGRTVETMTEDGNDGTAKLVEQYTNKATGRTGYRNDFTRGHYKVVVSVTEATATRRDKTVKSCLNTAAVAQTVGDTELAQAALITAVANQDGEGMTDLQRFARKRGIALGLIEPTEEEQAQLDQVQQNQQPDPQSQYFTAKAGEADAAAQEKMASAAEKKAGAVLKLAQAHTLGGPAEAPSVPDGLEAVHKAAQIDKTVAETRKIQVDADHMPQKLAIEATNARANQMKAAHQGMLARFKALFGGK